MKSFKIELRVDQQDSEKYDAVRELVRKAALDLMAVAILFRDKRDPQIMFSEGDMFSKDENMEILTPADLQDIGAESQSGVTLDGNWSA